jgi:hypothetical protein
MPGKKRSRKEPNLQHKVSFAVADFASGGSTPHTSTSLKCDTIQALIRQFGHCRLQEKVE